MDGNRSLGEFGPPPLQPEVFEDVTVAGRKYLENVSGNDAVNHPRHYGGDTTYECIKVIDAWDLGFNLGSVLKYVCRADHKGSDIQDLEKAVQYLQFEIEKRRKTTA